MLSSQLPSKEVEHDSDSEIEGYWTYNVSFTKGEYQSAVRAVSNSEAGPDDNIYSIIRHLRMT